MWTMGADTISSAFDESSWFSYQHTVPDLMLKKHVRYLEKVCG
jgi:hypothetical protein